ncbi:glycosyltransferase family 4 protein [Phaeobacter marinintestinus]|uniref:glycosyltransferase family 4 protein n=1 Tax=Falsiphaeobacter marinintestinus TaxID=1492905 RepID=UPI0011B4A115|nr:glycosyltransferase family 4 protein [Phaeobacter marinintestinus]
MTRVAFFAPMKPPDDPVPSGDREMARNLITAIGANRAQVDLVSNLRLRDSKGDAVKQDALREAAKAEVARLIETLPANTDLWVTYHNYYKVPDLIGPAVCKARGLPYVQIEASRAKSRLTGRWAGFAKSAEEACDAADVVFYLTAHDRLALERDRLAHQTLAHLPPFLPDEDLPKPSDCTGPMLTVGMMRDGDKLASYRVIADTLPHLTAPDWRLDIVGDGSARSEVEAMMAQFGKRVQFLGQLDRPALKHVYANAGAFLWPGVNEGFGMVYLEAQAAGVPVIAQDRPGVRDVILPGSYPAPEDGPVALAAKIDTLLTDPALRRKTGAAARDMVQASHLRPAATDRFWAVVAPLLEDHA